MTTCAPAELAACQEGTSCACLRRDFKRRAHETVQQARTRSKWQPAPPPSDLRIQEPWPDDQPDTHDDAPRKCEGCGGTLARHQPRYHPGCDPEPQPELEERQPHER